MIIKFKKYFELMKSNVTILVIITSYMGYYLGLRSIGYHMTTFNSWYILVNLIFGTWMTSSGACILNHYLERIYDAKMSRTKNRPLVTGKILPFNALVLGMVFSILGCIYLHIFVNTITAIIAGITIFLYVLIYTPSKRFTTLNTLIGSIPGALPPVGGWVAATGTLNSPAWILFGILFCWQIPHFLAIAIIYSSDYKKGGFKMLPTVYPESNRTNYVILFFTIALFIVSLGLYILKVVGIFYAISAALLGIFFLISALRVIVESNKINARKLMFTSIIYLPILLFIIIIESILF
tara:strand:+ start:2056 stop:2940 length:885 start_codon:yes stop_codon:yes gene_type:complete